MALNCLQIIQSACRRIGILSPNTAVTSTDPQIIQLVDRSECHISDHDPRHYCIREMMVLGTDTSTDSLIVSFGFRDVISGWACI